jgi:hypothetical protein
LRELRSDLQASALCRVLPGKERALRERLSAFFLLTFAVARPKQRMMWREEKPQMNDNVIQFRRRKPPRPPRPGLRKLAIAAAILALFVAAWGYFTLFSPPV